MRKKKIAAVLACMLCVSSMNTGVYAKEKEYKDSDIVMSVGDIELDYATACTYVRIMQAETYSYMKSLTQSNGDAPEDIWAEEMTGDDTEYKTYGEQFKGESLDSLKTIVLSELHSEDYDVEFTTSDEKKCEEVADDFMKKNSKETVEAMHASEDSVKNILRLMTIEDRVRTAIIKNIDENVSDKEAGQTTCQYAMIYKTDDEDDEATGKKADELIKAIKDSGDFDSAASEAGLTAQSISYTTENPEYDEYDEIMMENAVKLKEGECIKYEDKNGNTVVLYMESLHDESATEAKKDEIITQRRTKQYNDTIDGWKKDDKIKVDEEAWDSIKTNSDEIFDEMETEEKDSDTSVEVTASDGASNNVIVSSNVSGTSDK